jgi:hypothetical protein
MYLKINTKKIQNLLTVSKNKKTNKKRLENKIISYFHILISFRQKAYYKNNWSHLKTEKGSKKKIRKLT